MLQEVREVVLPELRDTLNPCPEALAMKDMPTLPRHCHDLMHEGDRGHGVRQVSHSGRVYRQIIRMHTVLQGLFLPLVGNLNLLIV